MIRCQSCQMMTFLIMLPNKLQLISARCNAAATENSSISMKYRVSNNFKSYLSLFVDICKIKESFDIKFYYPECR